MHLFYSNVGINLLFHIIWTVMILQYNIIFQTIILTDYCSCIKNIFQDLLNDLTIFVVTDSEFYIQYYANPTPPTIKPLYTLILAPFTFPKRSPTLAHILSAGLSPSISSTYASIYVPILTAISVPSATPNQPPVDTPEASSNTPILSPNSCGDLEYALKNNYWEYNDKVNLSIMNYVQALIVLLSTINVDADVSFIGKISIFNVILCKYTVNVGIQLTSEVVYHNIWLYCCHTFNMIYFLCENIILLKKGDKNIYYLFKIKCTT